MPRTELATYRSTNHDSQELRGRWQPEVSGLTNTRPHCGMHGRLHALCTCSLRAVLEFARPIRGIRARSNPGVDAGDTYMYESNANPILYVSLLKHRQAANAWEECLLVRGMAEDGKHNFFRHRPS